MADWQPLNLIKFSEAYKAAGVDTIFRAGTVVWTKTPGLYRVDKQCIEALQEKRIPFISLNSKNHSDEEG